MAKLKLNLPTGATVEKAVVTCFNVDNKSYLVLDAENIGSMGLPIILVCKIEDNKVVKITDPTEWQQAKDYLKGIIAGNAMNYVAVAEDMIADEVYYTQLTLPVASFDVIKNSYKVEEPVVSEPVISVEENTQVVDPIIPDFSQNIEGSSSEVEVSIGEPVIDITPEPVNEPIIPDVQVEVAESPVINDAVVEEPVVNTQETAGINFNDSKEAFMKACENMFDALVSKFQAELDSKK